jgi:hypothetical protein
MYRSLKIFSKDKAPKVRTTETFSVSVSLTHSEATPEAELKKWLEVLKELGKSTPKSPQEALARETVRGRVRELRRKLKTPTEDGQGI